MKLIFPMCANIMRTWGRNVGSKMLLLQDEKDKWTKGILITGSLLYLFLKHLYLFQRVLIMADKICRIEFKNKVSEQMRKTKFFEAYAKAYSKL